MNTKLLFYCINIDHTGFTKIVFEAVLPSGCIEDRNDAVTWVDDNISEHYDKFYLDYVYDWVVLLYEPTNDELKETEIVDTVEGKLIFKGESDFHYYELGKLTSETNKLKDEIKELKKDSVKPKKPKKENLNNRQYPSVWIEPDGTVYEVGFANHNEFACDWFQANEPEEFHRIHTEYTGKYPYEHLQDKGWIRILGWNDPPNFVITCRVTPKQRIALKDYCLGNDVPYAGFPELKS
jgi:hypothetical protein